MQKIEITFIFRKLKVVRTQENERRGVIWINFKW